MLTSVLESLGDMLRDHFKALHTLLAGALRDADAAIRSSAMRATSMIIPWLVTKEEIVCHLNSHSLTLSLTLLDCRHNMVL